MSYDPATDSYVQAYHHDGKSYLSLIDAQTGKEYSRVELGEYAGDKGGDDPINPTHAGVW